MRKIFLAISAVLIMQFVSCGDAKQDDLALLRAKECYDSLLAGNYGFFIRSTYLPDSIPPSYREQLETNLKMFMARMSDEHHGITAVSPLRCTHDTAKVQGGKESVYTANAFLELAFGDSAKEEIVVPMVLHNDSWLMR